MGTQNNNTGKDKQLAVFIWLSYFNKYLFEEGTITEKEYSQMTEKIANYKPA